jgi:rfaE bifunctional protein nucleotidyltransferase chain/domain
MTPCASILGSLQEAAVQSRQYREQGLRVVLTHGCFDIIHSAHPRYLQMAAERGDILFVGVNTDEDVRRIKGPTRPVRDEEDRLLVIAAFASVTHVVLFDDNNQLIEAVRPHEYVASATSPSRVYQDQRRLWVLREVGAEITEIGRFSEKSSTALIQQVSAV